MDWETESSKESELQKRGAKRSEGGQDIGNVVDKGGPKIDLCLIPLKNE